MNPCPAGGRAGRYSAPGRKRIGLLVGALGPELEEHFGLDGRHLAGQVPQTEKRRVPVVHSAPPNRRTIDRCKHDQQVVELNARIGIDL